MTDDAPAHVAAQHALYEARPDVAAELTRLATGGRPAAVRQIRAGMDNEVHVATLASGTEVVVRIRRFGGVPHSQEAWCLEQCRRAGAAVAEVLWVGEVDLAGQLHDAMVQTLLPGRPICDVGALESEVAGRVLEAAGESLRLINSVPAGGFWRRQEDGTWMGAEMDVELVIAERQAETPQLLQAGLSKHEIDQMWSVMRAHAASGAFDSAPVLCHGDFCSDHILVTDDGRFGGIIDFGEFRGGPVVTDVAAAWYGDPNWPWAALVRGYGLEHLGADFEVRAARQWIFERPGYIAYAVSIAASEWAAYLVDRLRAAMRVASRASA